ncbi:MAG: LPS export ABC transporter periplasmic protein LptC [Thiobacillaceae bacterium]|jgi:LPS export ABC transporter protein LptC
MFARSPYWLPLGLLTCVALLSFWLDQVAKPDATNSRSGLGEPDAIVENFHSMLNDKDGRPLYDLSAKKLRYYGKTEETQIDAPIFQHLSDTDGSVRITALRANVSPDGESIIFDGQVNLTHMPPKARQGMTLQSSRIEAYPKIHLVKVPTPVKVSGPGLQLTASNLELDTESRILKLSGRVKAHYKS